MPSKKKMLFMGLCLLLSTGCAKPVQQVWNSLPAEQTASSDAFDLEITPYKQNASFFVGFRMRIKNKTSQPIQIDWNATRYLFKGTDQGVFVFKGVDPETVKGAIPPEAIAAGGTLEKEVFPVRTIGFHLREKTSDSALRFTPGPLPAGTNGILLVLIQNGNQWRETLSVRLRVETRPAQ